jgi:predicted nucleic-acid-binding Zn-ribbon protein
MTSSNLEAREISIAGRHLRCQVCEFTRFYGREAELSTGASFFGQDWANPKADCYVCEQCGFVHWFVKTRSVTISSETTALSEEIEELRERLEAAYADELEASRA